MVAGGLVLPYRGIQYTFIDVKCENSSVGTYLCVCVRVDIG